MKKITFILVLCFFALQVFTQTITDSNLAGFRASQILQNYPGNQFPAASYWISTGKKIAAKFSNTSPVGIWIVSLYISNGITQFNFPSQGVSLPYVQFISSDKNEAHLTAFDQAGVKVWLQVEPGAANMDTLIHIVMNRYKHHPCVVGFGIDVEWYQTNLYAGGKKVTDAEAQRWEMKLKSIDTSYTLFLKHYGQSWMPPTYRGKIYFVDDSQEFSSLTSMVNEFKSWGQKFSPNKVAFQFGYTIDKPWWSQYADPVLTIGNSLKNAIPNCTGLFWVDFTITQVFPLGIMPTPDELREFELQQNYPNPYNATTEIPFTLHQENISRGGGQSNLQLHVYNQLGQLVYTKKYEGLTPGLQSITFDASTLPSGVYYYSIRSSQQTATRKMVLLK